jgi:hypothetical protein
MISYKEMVRKEEALAYFKALFQTLLGATEETPKNLSQDYRPLGQYLNAVPPKYETPINCNVCSKVTKSAAFNLSNTAQEDKIATDHGKHNDRLKLVEPCP